MKYINHKIAALILLFISACSNADKPSLIEQAELLSRIDDGSAPLIVDVRTIAEYESGHVPGAVNIPFGNYQQSLADLGLEKNREIVVYCETGGRAKKVEQHLRHQGFFEIRHLDGDMRAWRKAQLKTE
ncbi:rhodanese-like domain-containing protein [Oceanicoccus sp. KOV_DT_Chl]|uniref:rhodanese-like domain-containing protein n=1 Tax=Oceanicoccus sp. KOV_DT_Chl TaxID=1904639 RepID=UPI000C7BF914|nr:rhodanese-like domain-containing protein [Oceanicoccus sp. KOV_DT_Chl]